MLFIKFCYAYFLFIQYSIVKGLVSNTICCHGRRTNLYNSNQNKDEQWKIQQEILSRRQNKNKMKEYFENVEIKRKEVSNGYYSIIFEIYRLLKIIKVNYGISQRTVRTLWLNGKLLRKMVPFIIITIIIIWR
jgi:hypothetical protein